jgi:hypothetical protein
MAAAWDGSSVAKFVDEGGDAMQGAVCVPRRRAAIHFVQPHRLPEVDRQAGGPLHRIAAEPTTPETPMSHHIDIPAGDGTQTFRGYLALPASGRGPGIVIAQEIFGVNANMRATADLYAEEGYVAIVPDLFWRRSRASSWATRRPTSSKPSATSRASIWTRASTTSRPR